MWVLCACKVRCIPSVEAYRHTGIPAHGGRKLRARYGDVAVRDLRGKSSEVKSSQVKSSQECVKRERKTIQSRSCASLGFRAGTGVAYP